MRSAPSQDPRLTTDPAGTLDSRIQVQRPVTVNNEYGEPEKTWQTVATVWASIVPLSGRELWNARQVQADVTHQIAIRDGNHVAGINSTWRVCNEGRVFEIEAAPLRNERGRTMRDLLCKEQADGESARQGATVSTV